MSTNNAPNPNPPVTTGSSDEPLVEYAPGTPFPGVIGHTVDTSVPAWPESVRAEPGAPNVIVFIWDDVGYGQLSPFGGLCPTPTLDRLAERGLRYTNFHTTALCSPTRASLLTGRNHHSVGMSAITTMAMGFPGHDSFMGFEHGMLPEILVERGYNTFAIGKWHLVPSTEGTAAGPFHRWPLGRGFERFYGFLGGETDQWYPDLTHDNHWVPQPAQPEEGYHLNADLADHAIGFIKDAHVAAPDKPFFLYYSTGAGHAPHHVEPEWIERHRGRFSMGWDEYRRQVFERQKELGIIAADMVMTTDDPDVPAWDSLSAEAQEMYARQMEVYAAFLEQTDHHFGRVIEYLEMIGELDNTIVLVLSDNGASAEGGEHGTFNETLFFNNIEERLEDNVGHIDEWGSPDTYPHYAWGWAWAGDTPFRRWKRETYRGGVTDPCIISWPSAIGDAGSIRTQYAHVTDVMPTLLEALGIDRPEKIRGVDQTPLHGTSLAYTWSDPDAESRHTTQYFEMLGSRSIYHEGWKANCPLPGPSFAEAAKKNRRFGQPLTAELLAELDATGWELYDVANDPGETQNLAATHPERLEQMVDRWYGEAERYGVFPLASAELGRFRVNRPQIRRPGNVTIWYPDAAPVFYDAAPRLLNRSHAITADLDIPSGGADGVLVTHGSRHGGYALFVHQGKLKHIWNYVGLDRFVIEAPDALPTGAVTVRYEFEATGEPDFRTGLGSPGRSTLFVNDEPVASMIVPHTIPNRIGSLGFSCGYAAYDSVAPDMFSAPARYAGTLHEVRIDTSGDVIIDAAQSIANLMAEQ